MTELTAKRIRDAREAKGLTQIEAAIAIGVSVASYRLWEQGGGSPKPENKSKLIKVLGLGGVDHGKNSKKARSRA